MDDIQYSFVLYMGHGVLSPLFRNMTEEFVLHSVSDVMSVTNHLDKVTEIPQEYSPSGYLNIFSLRLLITAVGRETNCKC